MHPKNLLTLHNQLALPMIPFFIDTLARALLLRGQLSWYQIPDLVMFSVTYAFFCLGVMMTVNPYNLPTDEDANIKVELVRQRLLAYSIWAICLGAGISFFRCFDESTPNTHLYKDNVIYIFMLVLAFFTYSFIQICRTLISYVNRV